LAEEETAFVNDASPIGAPPRTLPDIVRGQAQLRPDQLAIVDGATRLTWSRLNELVDQVARGLAASGIEPGDRVCVWSPNSWHWVAGALGAQAAGAALVPLNTRYTGAEARDVLERARVRALFVPDAFLGRDYAAELRAADGAVPDGDPVAGLPDLRLLVRIPLADAPMPEAPGELPWEELLARGARSPHGAPTIAPDDVADILFTSGTTGRSKGAMSAHRQTIGVAEAWADCAEVTDEDVYLLINPLFHSFGYKAGLVVCLLRGATIVPQRTFDADAVLEVVEREGVTIIPGAPTIFYSLLSHPRRDEHDLSSLRLAVTGAAMVPVALVERMREELTFRTVLTAYGLSEAVVVTMCRSGDDPETISRTSGCATAGFEIRIAGPDDQPLPAGEDGEIQVRGENVMLGYLDDPRATAEAIGPGGWLRTGDVGHLDDRGYLTITDRLKDMFTVGGFNVYPAEVEQAIACLDDVLESAVIGMPDDRLGEVGRAFVVPRPGREVTAEVVLAHCRERLANFKVPRRVDIVTALPRNAAGKVLKAQLRAA
jgi:acyl-CoA synthetase (AMP-forming)/AMP-acid ligase II